MAEYKSFQKTRVGEDISKLPIISYNNIREEITFRLNPGKEPLIPETRDINKKAYWVKSSSPLLGKHIRNYYLLLEPVSYFFTEDSEENHWKVRKSRTYNKRWSQYVTMRIIKRRVRLQELLDNSRLSKFNNVIADDDYFSAIPDVNDIAHWDNGIVYAGNIRIWADAQRVESTVRNMWYTDGLNDWDKFQVSWDNLYNGEDLLNMIDKIGHEDL